MDLWLEPLCWRFVDVSVLRGAGSDCACVRGSGRPWRGVGVRSAFSRVGRVVLERHSRRLGDEWSRWVWVRGVCHRVRGWRAEVGRRSRLSADLVLDVATDVLHGGL